MEKTPFTVDAALLRELGERLIGRSHIALAELIKNAYDADAHVCRIEIKKDEIVVSDDGHGISEQEFHNFWMRIGTTHKVDQRRSRDLQRPMTGSKGLGRLSAQFLAHETELQSTAHGSLEQMLYALVDWRDIRKDEDMDIVEVAWEMRNEKPTYANGSMTGTTVRLKGLRSPWNKDAIEELGSEVWMLRPPLRFANRRSPKRGMNDFFVDIDAPDIDDARASFDARQRALLNDWKARINGVLEDGRRGKSPQASVTVEFKSGYPDGSDSDKVIHETISVPVRKQHDRAEPAAIDRARFEILVFKPAGKQASGLPVGDVREYLKKFGSVSLYDAGFRLPYYGSSALSGQDWLNIGVDQGRRLIASELLPSYLKTKGRYLLDLPNPGRIFGSVEVDTNHEHSAATDTRDPGNWLRIQPGRDRLAHNGAFDQLRDLVRFSIDFYANRYRALADAAAEKGRVKEPPRRVLERAISALDLHRTDIPEPVFHEIKQDLVHLEKAVKKEEDSLDSRAVLLAPLATAGMAALAFNHELARETRTLSELKQTLRTIAKRDNNKELEKAAQTLEDFEVRFQLYRSLFSPLANSEDKKPGNLRVYGVLHQLMHSVRSRMPGVTFDFRERVDRDLRFPTGSFVEWSALLQNVLFNAWNAMLDCPRKEIQFQTLGLKRRRVSLQISDTGVGLAVPPEQSSFLFEPFERQTTVAAENRSIMIGGEGLGLAIVKMIAKRRLSDVAFVHPPRGYSTTFELTWRA